MQNDLELRDNSLIFNNKYNFKETYFHAGNYFQFPVKYYPTSNYCWRKISASSIFRSKANEHVVYNYKVFREICMNVNDYKGSRNIGNLCKFMQKLCLIFYDIIVMCQWQWTYFYLVEIWSKTEWWDWILNILNIKRL